MKRFFLGAAAFALGAACAQEPTKELELVSGRVEAAREKDAAVFAPELLARAESGLEQAERLDAAGHAHREALRAAADASLAAEDALRSAETARAATLRKLEHLQAELEALLDIARSRGAEEGEEIRALGARCAQVEAHAESGDLLGALDEATALKPVLLAFEQRYR